MDTLKKACSYCIYQERTQAEVREKLGTWGIFGSEAEEIIAWLITENFINEERFAKQYAGGKFRVKKWGRRKIKYELQKKGLSDYCIKSGLNEIADDDYQETLKELAHKKREEYQERSSVLMIKKKVTDYLLAKGYDLDDIIVITKEWV